MALKNAKIIENSFFVSLKNFYLKFLSVHFFGLLQSLLPCPLHPAAFVIFNPENQN
jgi:hypothetical protein